MENDSISSSSSESKLPLIVGIIGFALGAAGLVLGIKAKSAAQTAQDAANEASKKVEEVGTAIASKAAAADLQAVNAELGTLKQASSDNFAKIQTAIDDLNKVVKKPAPTPDKGKTDGGKATPAGPGVYEVAKGDTLSSIAKKNGISLKALQELNPGVNSNKLQIGQKLKTK